MKYLLVVAAVVALCVAGAVGADYMTVHQALPLTPDCLDCH